MLQRGYYTGVGHAQRPVNLSEVMSKYLPYIELDSPDVYTKFNKMEEELNSHMLILNHSSVIAIYDLAGNITFVNDKFCELSKYSREELLGKPYSIVRHPDMPASVTDEMWRTIANGKVWRGELKNRAKDNSTYWVLATMAPVLGDNGRPVKYISMRVDITALKHVENELREAKKKIDYELLENVNYAKHIHHSFLTLDEDIKAAFPESFLIYKAAKIISGDFYRVDRNQDDQSIIVVGDSTGHGMSASYISITLLNALSRLLREGKSDPGNILWEVNKEVNQLTRLEKRNPITESADTIVCSIDHRNMVMDYASANLKAVLIREDAIVELEKQRNSIGDSDPRNFSIPNRRMRVKKGDRVYLFSDGMRDQIGGPNDKRLGYRRFLNILHDHHKLPMEKQRESIEKVMNKWQGNNGQTDDVTLLGFEI